AEKDPDGGGFSSVSRPSGGGDDGLLSTKTRIPPERSHVSLHRQRTCYRICLGLQRAKTRIPRQRPHVGSGRDQTHALQQTTSLFDLLVSDCKHARWGGETERLGGL